MKINPTPETIWKRPAYLPYVHPPLTDKVIRKTEKKLGITLPDEFTNILRVQNGGPIRFRFRGSDFAGELIAGIGSDYPSITDFDLDERQEYVDFSLNGLVPFVGDGHWYHCLDFRKDAAQPTVSYIDVECNHQEKLANSFAEFLSSMELDLDNESVMRNVSDFDDAMRQLSELFGSDFEPKISNIGVPYQKCQTGTEWDECFWISSNQVAHQYSGKDPSKFEFKGDALLFPELPDNAVIFESPENHVDSYRSCLHDAGIELVSVEDAAMAT